MANIERTVDIIFGGKTDQLDRTISSVGGSLGKLTSVTGGVVKSLGSVGKKILKVDAVLTTLAGAGLVYATNTAGDFSDQIAEIATLTDMSVDDLGAFREQILNYAADSTASIEDINSALYQAVSLGIDYQDSVEAITSAEKLATAGKSDLKSTTELLIGTLNSYGESVDQAGHYSDVFFNTVRMGKTTIPELAASMAKVTSLAAGAGVPIETLTAAIAALTSAGLPTKEAITGLRAAITNIIKPTTEAADLASSLGIQFNAAGLEANGFDGIMRTVRETTGGNTDQMAKLFGNVRGLNAAMILGSDSSGRFADSLLKMEGASGAVDTAYQKMAKNFGMINQNLANNLRATLIGIGDPILDQYGDIAEAVKETVTGINSGIDAGSFDELYSIFEEFVTNITDVMNGMAEALPEALAGIDYTAVQDGLREINYVVSNLFGGLDLTKPDELQIVIQHVVDVVGELITVTAWMGNVFNATWDTAKTVFSGIVDYIEGVYTRIQSSIQALGTIGEGILDFDLSSVMSGVKGLFWDTADAAEETKKQIDGVKQATAETSEEAKKITEATGQSAEMMKLNKMIAAESAEQMTMVKDAAEDTGTGLKEASEEAENFKEQAKLAAEVAIAKFQEVSEITQTSIEWGAKIDIEQIKADAKVMESALEGVASSVASTEKVLGDLSGAYLEAGSAWKSTTIEGLIRDENKRRDQTFDLQQKLTEKQISLIEKKQAALGRDQGIIQIDGSGLEPHLEAFMWEILSQVQIRVNEEYQEFLLGI